MTGVSVRGVAQVNAALTKMAAGIAGARQKPVYVGTTLFRARFVERGTRRGVRPTRFLERAARGARAAAKGAVVGKLEAGEVLAGLVELARKVRSSAAAGAPRDRGVLARSIKIQVGGRPGRGLR